MYDYKIFIGVKDEDMVVDVTQNIGHLNYKVVIGNNIKCFSELVNNCIKQCTSEIFIFLSHRVRPTENDILRLCELIKSGYGYVGLYRFACFALHRDIIKRIGYFDENFISGGYEDDDYRLRLQLADIAVYEDHSVMYISSSSTWINVNAREYFAKKYIIDTHNKNILKTIKDDCDLSVDTSLFFKFDKSVHVFNIVTTYVSLNLHEMRIIEDYN